MKVLLRKERIVWQRAFLILSKAFHMISCQTTNHHFHVLAQSPHSSGKKLPSLSSLEKASLIHFSYQLTTKVTPVSSNLWSLNGYLGCFGSEFFKVKEQNCCCVLRKYTASSVIAGATLKQNCEFQNGFFYIIMIQSSLLFSKHGKEADRTWKAFITNDLIIGFGLAFLLTQALWLWAGC